ncbi:peptidoglycan-binding protein [Streptomyces sp. NPDC055105]|uniref:peptidoglycan-binding protein n=1 Tax=Streptomyces sp. NPDC055105 TaxID=3365719 RepID=UPI0037CFCEAA
MLKQQAAALKSWPFIPDVEKAHGLPAGLLIAVGSRETNLTNKIGDGGHGFGVWQRDNRWHDVDETYLKDVRKQAEDAATLLAANYKALDNWGYAVAAYNRGLTGVKDALAAGKSPDSVTAGGDYAADVLGRLAHLQETATAPSDSSSTTTYTVKKGDTLTSIAKAHSTTVAKLVTLNGLKDADALKVGQKLKLSGSAPSTPAYEPFPGAAFFHGGRHSAIVTAMGRRLVAEGCGAYSNGPGPNWTNADRESYRRWQKKAGYSGDAADGIPGKTSWDKLHVPKS